MAAFQRTSFDVHERGTTVYVPNDKRAKLMYFLNCINAVLEFDDDNSERRFRDYHNYRSISSIEDKKRLVALCLLLRPDKLEDICILNVEDIHGTSNKFIEIEETNDLLYLNRSVMINGQQKRAKKVMLYKISWLREYYINPLRSLADEIDEEEERSRPQTIRCDIQ